MNNEPFDVAGFLEQRRHAIVGDACARVSDARLTHYDAAGPDTTADRLDALFGIVVDCCRAHRLDRGTDYADSLAHERHGGGFPLREAQTAINVLEEAVWRSILSDVAPADQGDALGMVSTVLGAIKDRLACVYVARLRDLPSPTLHLDSLFAGTEGGAQPV